MANAVSFCIKAQTMNFIVKFIVLHQKNHKGIIGLELCLNMGHHTAIKHWAFKDKPAVTVRCMIDESNKVLIVKAMLNFMSWQIPPSEYEKRLRIAHLNQSVLSCLTLAEVYK